MIETNTTLHALLRDRSNIPHVSPEELRTGLASLRLQNEEVYKLLTGPIISRILSIMVQHSEQVPTKRGQSNSDFQAFDSPSLPCISIGDYLDRIIRYTPCSAECYILALLFIDRIVLAKNMKVTKMNVHQLLFTSVLIASKLLDDCTMNNKYYSHVAGIDVKDLNSLERKFLSLMDYNLNVSLDSFEFYRLEVEINAITMSDQPTELLLEEIQMEMYKQTGVEGCYKRNVRRSQSFNGPSEGGFGWSKRRSFSFSVSVL